MSAANAVSPSPPLPSIRTTQLRPEKRVTHVEADEPIVVVVR